MISLAARRKATNIIMFSLTGVCTLIAVSVLFFILGYLLWQGGHALSWNFFTKLPTPVGETGGGFANAILGSAKVLLLAAAIGVPVGFLSGVYLAEFAGAKPAFIVRYTTDLLNGVPSIVMGMFAYIIIVVPMGHFSTLAGGIALGVMMIPITVRSTEEFLRSVPNTLREGALALGATKWKAVATVVIPAALPGIMTGVMLALARVAGETAPLLFTAFGNRFWSPGWNQPTATLPDTIYKYAISPYDDWHEQAWAAGLVLLLLVLAANIGSRYLLRRRIQISRG
jgi:phosphate transport system permease protein